MLKDKNSDLRLLKDSKSSQEPGRSVQVKRNRHKLINMLRRSVT
jgi:hypothetical protein